LDRIFTSDNKFERKGFVFVCDTTDVKSATDISIVIDKMIQIEKTNNLHYPKCILLNKIDKIQTDKGIVMNIMNELNRLKTRYKIKYYKVSALNGKYLISSLREFFTSIYQLDNENKIEHLDDNLMNMSKEYKINCSDKINLFSKKLFCGSGMFNCGVFWF
jgi:GTPase Era involved in 16S rRNA processing